MDFAGVVVRTLPSLAMTKAMITGMLPAAPRIRPLRRQIVSLRHIIEEGQ